MASRLDRKKKAALDRLDAELRADDITPEQYSREEARIHAGTSKYLKKRGLIARASEGDVEAIVRIVIIVVVIVVALSILGAAFEIFAGGEGDDGGGFVGDDDGDFEGGDDDFEEEEDDED